MLLLICSKEAESNNRGFSELVFVYEPSYDVIIHYFGLLIQCDNILRPRHRPFSELIWSWIFPYSITWFFCDNKEHLEFDLCTTTQIEQLSVDLSSSIVQACLKINFYKYKNFHLKSGTMDAELINKMVAEWTETCNKTNRRWILGFCGMPGAGKSTISQAFLAGLKHQGISAVLVPMDGQVHHFHSTLNLLNSY